MTDFKKIPDAIDMTEDEAIQYFGADKIGTKELRMALSGQEKQNLLNFLIQRYQFWAMRMGEPIVMNFTGF